LQGSAPISHNL